MNESIRKTVAAVANINGCTVIRYSTGRFGFVGKVPAALCYAMIDGSAMSDETIRNIQQFGFGLFKKHVKLVSFATEAEAVAALNAVLAK